MVKFHFKVVRFLRKCMFSVLSIAPIPAHIAFIMDGNRRYARQRNLKEGAGHDAGIVNRYGVRIHFSGNLQLLSEPIRNAAKKLTAITVNNSNAFLTLCVAYTSTDKIIHAIQKSCEEKWAENRESRCVGCGVINLVDIEKQMYMAIAPDPDIVIRTSDENRLSNFLLWQSVRSYLFSTSALWPDISYWHLVWVVLSFQRNQSRLEKKKKQL
ncbi:hypothetical protein CRYUN_Cryun06bG0074600 [Craigia yunnanensis]